MSRKRKKRERGQLSEYSGYKPVKLIPRSPNQKTYINSIYDSDIVLCSGPAGSGKTHLVAGVATKMMKKGEISRIIICRPIVGVGKDIGYLPGPMEDKVGPYLVPLFDEFSYYCEHSLLREWSDNGQLEIVPLSMMRGRTFTDSMVILDEAQNATMMELRMLLTRIGQETTMVLIGDLSQSDLPKSERGAFSKVIKALSDVDGISAPTLIYTDIVRHPLLSVIQGRLAGI